MQSIAALIASTMALLAPAVAFAAPAPLAGCLPPETETVIATRALDGSSFRTADGRTVRLAGIEAPTGDAARAALDALIAGETVPLHPLPRGEDRWGRIVAHVPPVEDIMVSEGLAHVAAQDRDACLTPLIPLEAEARAEKLGVWAGHDYVIAAKDGLALSGRLGDHVVAMGKLASARASGDRVYLNFARHWKSGLSLIVARKDWQAIGGTKPPESLVNRWLRVRGRLEWQGGPVIIARTTEPVEILGRAPKTMKR